MLGQFRTWLAMDDRHKVFVLKGKNCVSTFTHPTSWISKHNPWQHNCGATAEEGNTSSLMHQWAQGDWDIGQRIQCTITLRMHACWFQWDIYNISSMHWHRDLRYTQTFNMNPHRTASHAECRNGRWNPEGWADQQGYRYGAIMYPETMTPQFLYGHNQCK